MSMMRQDPLTGRWVIIAPGRSARPNDFPKPATIKTASTDCPFCPGNEAETTPEIVALGRAAGAPANSPGWRLRAFKNMFPALVPEHATMDQIEGYSDDHPLFVKGAGVGHHEVVVYDAKHEANPATLGVAQWGELLTVLRGRTRAMFEHREVRYVSAFCNRGAEAGATLVHPHMQIIGAPEVPLFAAAKDERAAEYLADHGRCLMCDLVAAELKAGARVFAKNEDWVCFTPWASRFPWEMMFAPRRHCASMAEADDDELEALAEVLLPALQLLFKRHGDLSLNIVIHNASLVGDGREQNEEANHWHLEILPRLSKPAGLEVGTGYAINAVVPEEAALWLRESG